MSLTDDLPDKGTMNTTPRTLFRVGAVSFLNTKPLIYGLDQHSDVALVLDVPSRLLEDLRQQRVDVALLPVIDYQRVDGLCIVPSGGIGSDGETLTVRIFSKCPISLIHTLACDTDSHTSVALARIIFAERYGIRPTFIDWRRDDRPDCDATLLIGDKVVCEEPAGFEHQLDLGLAWKSLTGLPFVFAVWTARQGVDLADLPHRLEQARKAGLSAVREIVRDHALHLGWPAGLALQYLTLYLKYEIGPRQLEAIRRFHELAARHSITERPARELKLYGK